MRIPKQQRGTASSVDGRLMYVRARVASPRDRGQGSPLAV